MNKFLIAAALAPVAIATPSLAQVNGIAVANPEGAVLESNAWKTAISQIQTTYKAQLDQAQSRQTAVQNELRPLVDAFQKARSAPNANEAALRTQANTIQQKEQAANAELQRLTQPVQRARAYAAEQIGAQLQSAVNAAMSKKKVTLLLRPEAAVQTQPSADITADVTAELNRLVPNVSITPPANWQPGGQQGAAAAPAAGAAPAARPAATPGR
ncbi:OmpH family outer membrane protein [Sphingomonas yantingensis]|uniref:Skp family chaperone for outer membrane proteins n=1 Tax=Sphingomonas yantingensis TaxID=1241761 RepID=A0A7W9AQT6_9SPHN|nr:OmpH family outer membrane protein [Sphingomonas yantingensis]MBB5698726.1 Skp family chaperone for outer membrane proteins [Sphingomonas yantingensis]